MTELYKDMELVYKPSIDRLRDDMARVKELAQQIALICSAHDYPCIGSLSGQSVNSINMDAPMPKTGTAPETEVQDKCTHDWTIRQDCKDGCGPYYVACLECGVRQDSIQAKSHTDHPSRVWDRTCPACSIQEVYDRVDNDYERKGD